MKRAFIALVLMATLLVVVPADAASVGVKDGIRVTSRNTGDLIIQGTSGDDSPIFVMSAEDGISVRIGSPDPADTVFSGEVRNVTATLGNGQDVIHVAGADLPGNLVVNAGGGGDEVAVGMGSSVAGVTNLQLGTTTGNELDVAYLSGSEFAGNVTVGGKAGFQALIASDVTVGGNLNVLTDGGASVVDVQDSDLGGLIVSGGRDADAVSVRDSSLGSDPQVSSRGGNDSVTLTGVDYDGTAKVNTDSGDDYVDLAPTGGSSEVDLRTGAGNDRVQAAIAGSGSNANGGPGMDTFDGSDDGITLINFEEVIPVPETPPSEMIVTANPDATEAGAAILRRGGTAVDAMIAAQAMLSLVEPQSSGIGGGAFVVYYDAATGETTTYDAREKAPAAATEDRFLEAGGFFSAWQSGLSVGVPGIPRLLEDMHESHGDLPWNQLFEDATAKAIAGFPLTERTSSQVGGLLGLNESCDERLFFRDPAAFEYFANPDCTPKPAGTVVENLPYAGTLLSLADGGADNFYHGELAEKIAAAVQSDLNIAGDMTTADLANYDVIKRDPVCLDYRGHNVCGMGPPSSGGLTVGQILGILEPFDLGDDPLGEEAVHLFTQAGRLAYADRGLYIGDSDFITVPVDGMLDKDYLATRSALITDVDLGRADAGVPPGDFDPSGPQTTDTESGTTHLVIRDQYGNALSMTSTVESSFGNGVMVDGFLLNNQLTDFSFRPVTEDGEPIANRVQANKRPRSSMAPTIVLDAEGKPELLTGSPGGSRIIGYTAQSIINVFDFGLTPQEAINVPHFMNRNGSTDIEEPIPGVTDDYDAEALKAQLEARGHSVNIRSLTSGLSLILVDEDGLVGGADLRRDGTVGGRGASSVS